MKRTQILLDERTYGEVKRLSFEKGKSMGSVIRGLLKAALSEEGGESERPKMSEFSFIGSAREEVPDDVSVRHDQVLGERDW